MKKLFVIMLVILISAGLFAETKKEMLPKLNDVNPDPVIPVVADDVGDLIWELDVEAICVDNQLLGVEYDGMYIWVTGAGNAADPNYLYKIDPVAGTLVNSYEQPAASTGWGIRDLAYAAAENKIYGGNESSFFSFDIATETWTTEFSSTFGTIRALAYDGNHFWTKSFSDPIYEFDVTGTLHNTYPDANSAYGFAYDSFEDCLWLFASTTTFVQFGLDGAPTGTTHAVTLPNAGIIGGAFYYEGGLVPGKTILGCLGQGTPDVAYGMELRDAAPLTAPGPPTGVAVTPDAGGALTADIAWTCPALDVGGVTLTDLDEMRVYRDGVLIYTDTTPTIGGSGSYADAVPASGNYAYSVVGFNDAGEGIPVVVSSWIGEDIPNVVTDLVLAEENGNGYLTWVNPTTGFNGGAFNNAILGYHIERNDGVMFEITGIVTEYTDNTIPAADFYCYTVTPYNSIGDGGSVTSNLVLIGAGDEIFFDDFEAGLGNWNSTINSGDVEWLIFAPPYPNTYTMPPTSSGNVCSADSDEAGSGTTTDCTIELMTALDLSVYSTANIQFDNDWQAIDADDYSYVDVSIDGGSNWTNVLTFDEIDVRETHEIVDITAVAAGQSNVLIRFVSVQPGWDWWWTIDNVGVYATGTPVNPGSIEGTVVLAEGMGNVEEVVISVGGETTNPQSDGDYFIEIMPGTYDVTATLDGYDTEVIEDVEVTEDNATTGVDFDMFTGSGEIVNVATKLGNNYPNPFNPVTNISYSVKEPSNVTIEIYNIRGQLVKTLVNEAKETGIYSEIWNGTDNTNEEVTSGIYFYKMKAGNYSSYKKMMLLK